MGFGFAIFVVGLLTVVWNVGLVGTKLVINIVVQSI